MGMGKIILTSPVGVTAPDDEWRVRVKLGRSWISLSSALRGISVQGLSTRATSAGALLLALATGCAASNFDGKVFRQGNVSFRLAQVPEGWRQIEITDTAL